MPGDPASGPYCIVCGADATGYAKGTISLHPDAYVADAFEVPLKFVRSAEMPSTSETITVTVNLCAEHMGTVGPQILAGDFSLVKP